MFKFFVALLAASTAVMAGPVARATADVWDPRITSPVAAQVWLVGSTQVVAWDLNSIPATEYNKTGMLLLGHLTNNSEHLDISMFLLLALVVILLTQPVSHRAPSCH